MPIFSGGGGGNFALRGLQFVKAGDNSGNINFSSATQAKLNSTNLDITTSVQIGQVAIALLSISAKAGTGTNFYFGIAVDGTILASTVIGGAGVTNLVMPGFAMAWLVGDGGSHTFSPQGAVTGGTTVISNSNGGVTGVNLIPLHAVVVLSAS